VIGFKVIFGWRRVLFLIRNSIPTTGPKLKIRIRTSTVTFNPRGSLIYLHGLTLHKLTPILTGRIVGEIIFLIKTGGFKLIITDLDITNSGTVNEFWLHRIAY
jgi:hypothetical protein